MSVNLVKLLEEYISGDVVSNLATLIGESPNNTASAVQNALPSLLAGLADKSADPNALTRLFDLMLNESHDGSLLSNLGALSQGGEDTDKLIAGGNKLFSTLFGDKAATITDLIANLSGLGNKSAGSLLSFLSPVVLGLIGKTLKLENNETASGLANLLGDQGGFIKNLLPAGLGGLLSAGFAGSVEAVSGENALDKALNSIDSDSSNDKDVSFTNTIADALEKIEDKIEVVAQDTFSSVKNVAEDVTASVSQFSANVVDESKDFAKSAAVAFDETAEEGGSKLLPWLLIAAALALLWGLLKSCSTEEKSPETPVAQAPTPTPAQPATMEVTPPPVPPVQSEPVKTEPPAPLESKFYEKDLSTGYHIQAAKEGVESKLVSFIESSDPVSEDLWFNMEGIQFDTAKASIRAESNAQINNIAEIMKAFPNVKIKLGGYTDNTGKPAGNVKLSGNRAAEVKKALAKKGIDSSRLAAEGYGSAHPVASNDTVEGRQKNRRIDIKVTEK